MSITTYSELQAAIADWMARPDLTSAIPNFIMLLESAANRRLRVRQMEATTPLSTTLGSVALPADFQAWRRLGYANGSTFRELEYVHPSYLYAAYPTASTDSPRVWTVVGSNIVVRPYDDTSDALTLDYYQSIPPLATADTNWLLTKWPDLYLFGSLAEASAYVKKPDDMVMWGSRRNTLFDEIEATDAKIRGPSAIKIFGATP